MEIEGRLAPLFHFTPVAVAMSCRFAFVLAIAVCSFGLNSASAQSPQQPSAQQRAFELHYQRYVAHPQKIRDLEFWIRQRQAEIATLKRQQRTWESLDRFRDGRPLMVTRDDTRLLLMELEADLARLEREKFLLVQYGYRALPCR